MDRAFFVSGDARFERLAGSRTRTCGQLASPSVSAAPPRQNGVPGYTRIDSVHQGEQDGANGVHRIAAVDVVIQFQLVRSARRSARCICSRSSGSCWMDVRLHPGIPCE